MNKYILAIDAGTTSSRAIIFDRNGQSIGVSQYEFTQHFPNEGWVEHDAIEIWETQLLAIKEVLENNNISPGQIHSMGITNQRETTIIWNRKTGTPIHKAIVWQDRRTASICEKLEKEGKADLFYQKTGLLLDAYFSGTKIKWILDSDPEIKKQAEKGELAFGTLDSWLIWKLTLFGQMCINAGDVKNTYGTGCFCIMNTGEKPVQSKNKMLTTIGYQINGKVNYALEGSVFISGAAVQWLRDQLGIISSASEIEALAETVENNGGITFITAMAGLGAPYWDPHATASIIGITRGTEKGHIARATLEAIAMRTKEIVIAMQKDAGITFKSLKVDGGGSTNNLLMQIQSNLLDVNVIRPETTETTALGAAFFAGLSSGYWPSLESLSDIWKVNKEFNPIRNKENKKIIDNWEQRISKMINPKPNE